MSQVEIARFADLYEAEIAAARLRAEGFDATLGGIEHARTDPLVLQALGGVRLTVSDRQAVEARARLESLRGGAEALPPETPWEPRLNRWARRARWPALTLLALTAALILLEL